MPDIFSLFLEPLSYGLLLRGPVATVLIGVICAVIGTFVVLKGLAFFGDALAHVGFTGIVVAFISGFVCYLGALVAAIMATLGIAAVSRRAGINLDTSISIFFSGVFTLGIVLMSVGIKTYTVDLFGNVLGTRTGDLIGIAGLGLLVLMTVLALYKELLFTSFDPVAAEARGLPSGPLQMLLLILLSVTAVVSVQAVGVVLVVAMLVTPSATAYLLTDQFSWMMAYGAGFGALAAVVGISLSYYLNVPPGGAIVLVATVLFLLTAISPRRGGWHRLIGSPAS